MSFPRQVRDLIEAFERLPGIGAKTAARLTFYLLQAPEAESEKLARAAGGLKKDVFLCQVCKNFSDQERCDICRNPTRDQATICVVASPLDVFSLEATGGFSGLYHVLHGVIDPIHNIGPDELYITDFLARAGSSGKSLSEVILALNPTMEGEATAVYLAGKLREIVPKLTVTRLGMGMPMGGDLQYADETTLTRALEGRREY